MEMQLQKTSSDCTFVAMPASNTPPAVETLGLTKRYGDVVAVDHLDLVVDTGSVALLGPNGAGKTTTVRMIATLVRPTSGTARVGGHDVLADGDAVRRRISLTGQFAALDPNLTGRENLRLVAALRGHDRGSARRIADELVERFDGGDFADRTI